MDTQEFAVGQRGVITDKALKNAGAHGEITDYGYHMVTDTATGKQQRKYDYAIILDDGTAFRIPGKLLRVETKAERVTTVTDTIARHKALAIRAAMVHDLITVHASLEALSEIRDQLRVLMLGSKLFKQATDAFWFVSGLEEHIVDSAVILV